MPKVKRVDFLVLLLILLLFVAIFSDIGRHTHLVVATIVSMGWLSIIILFYEED